MQIAGEELEQTKVYISKIISTEEVLKDKDAGGWLSR